VTAITSDPETDAATPTRAGKSSAADPTARERWRRHRMIVAAALLVAAVAVLITLVGAPSHTGDLDPRSYESTGTHALAALLAGRGVDVDTETTAAAAQSRAMAGDTLVVVNPDRLPADQLAALARTPADLVVVGAGPLDLGALALGVHPGGSAFDTAIVDPACALPLATTAGAIVAGPVAYQVPDGGVGCYPVADGDALVSFTRDGRQVTLLGDGTPLTNHELGSQGDAALGLGLFDVHPRVVWLAPPLLAPASDTGSQPTLLDLLPTRLKWAVLQLGIAVVILALWRGRRFGRLVYESLPVVVRPAETVVGRARLYRRSRSYDRAADALRAGTRDRLARRLGLPAAPGQDALIEAITRRLPASADRGAREIGALLYGPSPADDRALVDLAGRLAALEQEVVNS
jgi:Domain of unknown function (DUF4350)